MLRARESINITIKSLFLKVNIIKKGELIYDRGGDVIRVLLYENFMLTYIIKIEFLPLLRYIAIGYGF